MCRPRRGGVALASAMAAMAVMSVWEKRRCLPTKRQGMARAAALRRSHEARTCSNSAACSAVYSSVSVSGTGDRASWFLLAPGLR